MRRVIAWGTSVEYDLYRRWMEPEILKGNMELVALALNEEDYLSSLDGIQVIKLDELLVREYDYLINMNSNDDPAIARILELLKVPRDKVIPIELFRRPYFDLMQWEKVQKSHVSIIANNCWGGITCHSVGLRFNSPFVNLWMESGNYLTLLENLQYYMKVEPHFIREELDRVLLHTYPVIGLDNVELHFNHFYDFESAQEAWNRRKARLNYDNLLVEMTIGKQEELDRFLALPYQYKIGFSSIPCESEDIVYIPFYENAFLQEKYKNDFAGLVMHMAFPDTDECRQYNVLKLLNHEESYMRAMMI